MPNHLAGETSPYLLQHAHNPVDWHPWGPEALQKAQAQDKPIFLSIGYSACHWCHVMERESFANTETAALLNQLFICIKVDREERPDLDAVYMGAVSALTGKGGWPLSVWLTPAGSPFYGGTYFPDTKRYGMASFRQVILALADAWSNQRQELEQGASALLAAISREEPRSATPSFSHGEALKALSRSFDPQFGGWGDAPKFPQPMVLEYLLMQLDAGAVAHQAIRDQVERTLEAMARGGIYDQLRGGFHRYSTDERWLVPHFEKMLYDNAQLARCYIHAWQATGHDLYRRVAEETLEYLIAEMRHPDGGFFSSQDADSEGEEGKFFVWTEGEVERALGREKTAILRHAYGLTGEGNFEGSNILRMVRPPSDAGTASELAVARAELLALREKRVHPGRDDKILASWNGLTLAALADAARALGSDRFAGLAICLGNFLLREFMTADFKICRSWKDGRQKGQGFLEDYACLAEGFLALYQSTFDERWFLVARGLAESIIAGFARVEGGFYDTSTQHEDLVMRPRSLQDSPTPCGNSLAATVLLKMAAYTGDARYWDIAVQTLGMGAPAAARAPEVFGQWLCAHHLASLGLTEVAIVGAMDSPGANALTAALSGGYLPLVVSAARPAGVDSKIAILEDREPPAGIEAAAWVCTGQTCSAPVSTPVDLLRLLRPRCP
jgi:uncharacterized protein